MNSVCERLTLGTFNPTDDSSSPILCFAWYAFWNLNLLSGCLIVYGISEDLCSNESLYKEQGLFHVLLLFPIGQPISHSASRSS